jgi:hypothetical protein
MLAVSKCKFTEGFANTPVAITSDNVADYIYTVYKADVKAIQNLADIAMKLQAGGIIVPGSMTIQNTLNVSGDSNLGGKLEVKGDAILDSTLDVKKAAILESTLEVKETLNVAGVTTLGTLNTGTIDCIRIHATNNDSWLGHEGDKHNYLRGGTFLNGGIVGEGGDFGKAMTIDKDGNVVVNGSIRIKGRINFNNDSNYWIEGGTGAVSMTTWNPAANEQRWINFTNDGNLCVQPSGRGPSCVSCDRRIKENIIDVDSSDILNKLNQLSIQSYNYIDKRYYEGNTVYGLIAQDVKEVFPEAINIEKQPIPNINKDVTSIVADEDTIVLTLEEFTVKVDDDLYLVINDKPVFVKVLAFTDTTITLNKWEQYNANDKVLVYGTMIDDFHTLNQSYLGILSLSGIQELTKQIKELQAFNQTLLERLERLERLENKLDRV